MNTTLFGLECLRSGGLIGMVKLLCSFELDIDGYRNKLCAHQRAVTLASTSAPID
jgi:hypothetical protein